MSAIIKLYQSQDLFQSIRCLHLKMNQQTQAFLLLVTLCIVFQNGCSLENSQLEEVSYRVSTDANADFLLCRDMFITSAVKRLAHSRLRDEWTVENSDYQKKRRGRFGKRTPGNGNWKQESPQHFHDNSGKLEKIARQIIAFCQFKILDSDERELDAFKRDRHDFRHDEAREKKSSLSQSSRKSSEKFLEGDDPIWLPLATAMMTENDRELGAYNIKESKEEDDAYDMIDQHLAAFDSMAKKETAGMKPNRRRFGKKEVISAGSNTKPTRRRFGKEVSRGSTNLSQRSTNEEKPREAVIGETSIPQEKPRKRKSKRASKTDYQRRRFGKRDKNESYRMFTNVPHNRRFGKREDIKNYRAFANIPQNRRFGKREDSENYLMFADLPQNRRFGKREDGDEYLGNDDDGKILGDNRKEQD